MRAYTRTQAEADAIDALLFRAMDRAQMMSEHPDTPLFERAAWQSAAKEIRKSRASIRDMMHPKTRDETY
jgi:hypothetical protein